MATVHSVSLALKRLTILEWKIRQPWTNSGLKPDESQVLVEC